MRQQSAGVLLYRFSDAKVQVMLVHPGGPFWAHKDTGAWSIPKGTFDHNETALDAARREFQEETGFAVAGDFIELGSVRLPNKTIYAWALQGDLDTRQLHSNTFAMEWPKGSGNMQDFPEVDRGEWFDIALAREKIHAGQLPFIERLLQYLGS